MITTLPIEAAWGETLPSLPARRIQLRMLRESDDEAVFRVFGDAEVMRYWSGRPLADRAAALAFIREIHGLFAARTLFQWGVARVEDDRVLGTCTMFQWDRTHRRAMLGYAIGREHWGLGYGREAVERLVGFGFTSLGLHRWEADVDPRNERSLRLLERQGFRREGLLRERYFVGSEIQDSVWLGLLRQEWRPTASLSPEAPVPGATP